MTGHQHRFVLFAALVGAAWMGCVGAPKAQETPFAAFERSVPGELARRGIPGTAVVLVKGDAVVYEQAFGTANVETKEPISPNTLFRLGSTAKTFAALALATLAERGAIDVDVPIGRYAAGLHPAIAALTVHQLLTHTAGLADDAAMNGPADEAALAARVRAWNETAFVATPGDITSYANPGYALAGYVLECVTKKRFADAVREIVLDPLGMAVSTYRPLDAITHPLAFPHEPSPTGPRLIRPVPENAANYPPGSLFSSVHELSRFLVAMLNGGRLEGRQALPARAVAALTAHAAPLPGMRDTRYGFGVILRQWRGATLLENRGARLGYGSIYVLLPEQRVGAFLLANRTSAVPDDMLQSLVSTIAAPPSSTAAAAASPPLDVVEEASEAIGTYVNAPTYPKVILASKDGSIVAMAGSRTSSVSGAGDGWYRAPDLPGMENFRLVRGAKTRRVFLCAGAACLARQETPGKAGSR